METHLTSSPAQTRQLAFNLAPTLKAGTVICLYGDLAAGKTTFVQGLGQYFGLSRLISPTYIIVRQYPLALSSSPFSALVHLDFYRLTSSLEAKAFDLKEICSDPSNLVVIEWPEKIKKDLLVSPLGGPSRRLDIHFKIISDQQRKITIIEAPRPKGRGIY